jgi:hypothetical protein
VPTVEGSEGTGVGNEWPYLTIWLLMVTFEQME